mmetsp:Transcript_23336/g.54202  ORF Transcript_23336/g.54202 Transcript_23336/m.54202 type:complete len:107 (-) Transcript_23336:125-445(-)
MHFEKSNLVDPASMDILEYRISSPLGQQMRIGSSRIHHPRKSMKRQYRIFHRFSCSMRFGASVLRKPRSPLLLGQEASSKEQTTIAGLKRRQNFFSAANDEAFTYQ